MTYEEAITELKVPYLGDSDRIVEAKAVAIEALKKQTPKKPKNTMYSVWKDYECLDYWSCPNCDSRNYSIQMHCEYCDQLIDWGDGE